MSKEVKIKEPIRIRTKKLNNGNESIYLDIYVDGKRNYEFLKLYLVPEKDRATKNRNAETMKLANAGKSSVSCPLKPSDSAPLKHSTMPP